MRTRTRTVLETHTNIYIYIYVYICNIIAEGFFFILSFFVLYILSFCLVRLRTFLLVHELGAHIERRCSRARGADVTIRDVTIKNPYRKWYRGRE